LIQHTRLHRSITVRLESVFGRPVSVAHYDFSLWSGPTLAAQSITVAEDTRFGQEYFLRAEALTMRLRWLGLLRGRLEFGAISLDHPSLNLVRSAGGDWNLAEWLPHPSVQPLAPLPLGPQRPATSLLRITRVEVNSGRVNFKRNEEKIPFAFTDVNGLIEPESPGRWRFDLEAVPSRAAVVLQQAGTLHLSGHVGGTSSRLRPAALDLSWTGASISDILRLARSYDYGFRGSFALALHAQTEADAWVVEGRTELRQLHRWDLPLRSDNPALNLLTRMRWYPLDSGLQIESATIETPHSHASFRAMIPMQRDERLRSVPPAPFTVDVNSSVIDAADLLAWLRAFHPNVADDVSVSGLLQASAVISGWPPRVVKAQVESLGAQLTSARLSVPVHLGEIHMRYRRGLESFSPLTLSLSAAEGALHLEPFTKPHSSTISGLRLAGNLKQVRDLLSAAGALGWNISRGWDLEGPMRCDLRWESSDLPWQSAPLGTIDWGAEQVAGSLQAPFLNLPVEQVHAHAELKPGARHVTLSSASAFGAHWTGTFDRRPSDPSWQFTLAADRLTAAEFDRWLNPRWRKGLLDRVLPFLSSPSVAGAVPENLRGSGKFSVDQFALAPFILHRLQGDLNLEGRRIELSNAKAQFYGGEIGGSFEAELTSIPAYHLRLDFSLVDLAALTAPTANLADLFAGSATGKLSLETHGSNRDDLLASLECHGAAQVIEPEMRAFNMSESLRDDIVRPGMSKFHRAEGSFSCADRKLRLQEFSLIYVDTGILVSGTVDFDRNLNLDLTPSSGSPLPKTQAYRLTGTLAAPQIAGATAPATKP